MINTTHMIKKIITIVVSILAILGFSIAYDKTADDEVTNTATTTDTVIESAATTTE